ncbi:MAG: OmpA family protein [Solirubrobacterales bacterium]|nr:OmpA family protein [Solirubrobacterales bacterium]
MVVDSANYKPVSQLLATRDGIERPAVPLKLVVASPSGSDTQTPTHTSETLASDVLFAFNKSNLTAKAQAIIASTAQQIKQHATGVVHVDGYTDSKGSGRINGPLSRARAAAAATALRKLTPGIKYVAAGHGAADPVAKNTNSNGSDNPAGRALNRRVTLSYKTSTPAQATAPGSTGVRAPTTSATSMTFHGQQGGTFTVQGASAQRDGSLAVLRMKLVCDDKSPCDLEFPLAVNNVPQFASVPGKYYYLAGFYLQDPDNSDKYAPAFDTSKSSLPLTSNIYEQAKPGKTYQMWLYFPAPAAGAKRLTLFAPGGGGKINVPVT